MTGTRTTADRAGASEGTVHVDVVGGHAGAAAVAVAVLVIAVSAGPPAALAFVVALAVWFLAALAVVRARGARGVDIPRRAYNATFGWGAFVIP
ncbi:hypothetical protein ACFXPI_31870 [Streptomyces sp. NPDC059104]|uniref:hypothetical protein n=1 Tax=Streptomyces sp. NPDC059104 TaxID=3346729 RepID=UPI003685AF9D